MDRRRPRPTVPVEQTADAVHVPEHSHEPPKSNMRILLAAAFAAVLVIAYLGWLQYSTNQRQMDTNARLVTLEQYVAEAKIKRDAQNNDVNERITQAACDFLDRLPAGPLWDPMRETYGCGPGIDPGDFPAASQSLTPEQFYQSFLQTRIPEENP